MIKTGAFKGTGNKWLLLTGLTLGLISAALAFVYLKSAGDESGGGSTSAGPTTPVVVAAQDIAAGTKLTGDMLSVKNLSASAVLTGAYSDPAELVDQVTVVPVVAGEQVITAKVVGGEGTAALGDNPPASLVVPEGMRAVAAPIQNVDAVSGLIRPGDYVDVILALKFDVLDPAGESIGTDSMATTILQNVKVLSIEQDVTTTTIGEGEDAIGGTSPASEDINPAAGTATFLVPPIHSEVLGLAALCAQTYSGRLLVSLRGFGDAGPVPERTVWPTDGEPPSCAFLFGLDALP